MTYKTNGQFRESNGVLGGDGGELVLFNGSRKKGRKDAPCTGNVHWQEREVVHVAENVLGKLRVNNAANWLHSMDWGGEREGEKDGKDKRWWWWEEQIAALRKCCRWLVPTGKMVPIPLLITAHWRRTVVSVAVQQLPIGFHCTINWRGHAHAPHRKDKVIGKGVDGFGEWFCYCY